MTRGAIALRLLGALLASAASIAACWALAKAAVHTARGQRLDQLVLTAAQNDTGPMTRIVFPVLNTVTVPVIVAAILVAVVLALLQRRASMVVHLVVLVAGAAATTQVVKHLVIDRTALAPGLDVTPNSFPSGHTTLAAAVAIALMLASPRHIRSLVALLGAAWTAVAGIGTIAGGWHRPSDVLGALLVVGAWTFLVLAVDAVLAMIRARAPEPASEDHPHDGHDDDLGRDGTAEPPRPATWDDPDPVWDEEAQMWVAGHSAPAHEGAAARLRRDRRRRARSLLPVHSNGRVAAALLSLGAVLGVIVGAVLLATVPTPLDLASASAQARAYAATIGIVGGATAALFAVTLLVHVPALPSSSADPVRVR